MRIGIMADSHDHLANIEKAVAIFEERRVERVIHAGDFVAPFTLPLLARLHRPLIAVFGNNDGERLLLKERISSFGEIKVQPAIFEINGKRLVLMHEPTISSALAKSGEFDVVVVGHTHQAEIKKEGEALIINPGETCGWLTGRATVAILDLETLFAELVELR